MISDMDTSPGLRPTDQTLAWLLEPANPCVRWRTLRELLGRPDEDSDVQDAAEAVLRWPPVRRLLEMAANPAGYAWPPGIRLAPFTRPGRDLAQLARVGVPPGRPELAAGAAYLKTDPPDHRTSDCYFPQLVAAAVRYCPPEDPDVPRLVERVAANEMLADGNRPPTSGGTCCLSHSCHSAVARALDCVATVPEARRTPAMTAFLERGVQYLAAHRLLLKSHRPSAAIRWEYTKLHQPWGLDWLTDVLDLLDVATRLGMADDPALAPALELLLKKQQPDGRWPLEVSSGYRDRPLVANLLREAEEAGAPGRWVTLTALLMLRRCAPQVERLRAGETFPPPESEPPAGFTPYPWPRTAAEERAVRAEWDRLAGMTPILERLLAFARRQRLRTGWYQGLALGPDFCREWCCVRPKLIPRRTMKAAFPVARTLFLAPRGMFTTDRLCARLGVARQHDFPGLRPGSALEKPLWHVRVEPWTAAWDTVGVAVADSAEMEGVLQVMGEALAGFRRGFGRRRPPTSTRALRPGPEPPFQEDPT